MRFYDLVKTALSGSGGAARQSISDLKQMSIGEQLPYEATFGYA
jgi:hypothetical protein